MLCPIPPPTSALITDRVIFSAVPGKIRLSSPVVYFLWQRLDDYGNERTMGFTKQIALWLSLALLILSDASCVPRPLPGPIAGVTLQPGRFLAGFYLAPDFAPEKVTYDLEPFTVEQARGVDPHDFQALLQTELVQTWEANGLKVKGPQGVCRFTGAVHSVRLKGTQLRFLMGQISARLEVSGAITQEGRTVFAFSDRVQVSSPVNPGPAAPKEREILLRQAARTFVNHLLTELLLYGPPGPEEGAG